ncbi:hypothetical protein [Kribbella italica]|uniref:Uncharacterized protein n=1 Tax=Kribbella italica TaxID=1540520 RepID=A0A7W9MZH0_9ACTN|nr:hypothetical protein [Kribbella italica]MBB5841218.1 hypothetical protein [Kribbella italica]
MNNLNDSLPDLMRRATDDLEPESNDLVERGIQRGVTLRRRRTAMLSLSGAGAVLATAGIIVGGTQLFAGNAAPPVAAPPSTTPSVKAEGPVAVPGSPAATLQTLQGLLPQNLKQSSAKASYVDNRHHTEVVVDDGKGASLLTVEVVTTKPNLGCEGLHGSCTVRPDGAVVASYANESIFPYDASKNPWGIKNTVVEIFYPDGRLISVYNYNAPRQIGVAHTRANPLFSVQQLTALATSDKWVFPKEQDGPIKRPGNGKPTVPLEQTQQMLKSVLPSGLQFTRPETWGGGSNGHNGASYVVNDGKGAAQVDVLVQYEAPVTKCTGEGPQHCKVRPDGSVTGWSKNEPTYGDERQAINGVLANRVEIHYPDGRMITMTSYNGPAEKDEQHTRAKPTFSTDQLFAMAGTPGWKFPGTGKK